MDGTESNQIPKKLYRFRPLTVVKPKVVGSEVVEDEKTVAEELRNQEIFLARLDELNDPMDGLHHTVWDGDHVVWENFLRHYCLCLLDSWSYISVAANTAPFDSGAINVLKTPSDFPTDAYRELYDDFVEQALSGEELQGLHRELARKEKFHYEELRVLLTFHHSHFLQALARVTRNRLQQPVLPDISTGSRGQDLRTLTSILPDIADDTLRVAGEITHETNEQLYLIHRYNSRREHSTASDNQTKFATMFPEIYLNAAAQEIHGEFYVASFTNSVKNASMWAHYAEQHRGVCLIFEPEEAEERRAIEFSGRKKIDLYPVRYADEPLEFNFFANLGRLPRHQIIEGWLKAGDESSRLTSTYNDSYPREYWKRFIEKVSRKSSDWSYERELRLVQDSQFSGNLPARERILNYNFRHLTGIIFGMRTPVEVQLQLIEIIEEKLKDFPKKKFSFHKAGYSPTQSRFQINELSLIEFADESKQ